jgi:hypothetical protein
MSARAGIERAMATNQETVDSLVAEHCLKLFADYKLEIHPDEAAATLAREPFLLCGITGFTSRNMRGALVLATTREPLDRTNPADKASHRDWICELSNQLLGRVKNEMLTCGVQIHVSPPIALRGEHLWSPVLQRPRVAEIFTAREGMVCVWVDCEFDEGFELPESGTFPVARLAEGEALLF